MVCNSTVLDFHLHIHIKHAGTCANQYFLIEGANDTHLCNNTYLPESCFNNVDGIDCIVTSGYLNWLLPDGRVVQSSGTVGGLIFREENEIVKGTFQIEGVYTCNQTGSQIHIGLYSDSSINKGKWSQPFTVQLCIISTICSAQC